MGTLGKSTVVVAGGTGNVGSNVVHSLLGSDARVVVPSRSPKKITELRQYLGSRLNEERMSRLVTLTGDFGGNGASLADDIIKLGGTPDGVVSTLGRFVAAPSLLGADPALLRSAMEDYTIAHFKVARALLPVMSRGTFVFINGPLAFSPWKGSGAHLVSVATAAQHMLFRALAQELDGSGPAVVELVIHAFVRDRETQPRSPIPAEAVGAFIGHLLGEDPAKVHGSSIELDSMKMLDAAGITLNGVAVGEEKP